MNATDLTIVVPVYNMLGRLQNLETWLPKAVEKEIRILLVNDFSDESNWIELQQIARKSGIPSADVLRVNFGNPGESRNTGLDHVTSGWVAFWDSDDIPIIEEFLHMISEAEEKGYSIALGKFWIIDDETFQVSRSFQKNNLEQVVLNPGIWRFAFKVGTIGEARFPGLRMGEDQVFLSRFPISDSNCYFCMRTVYKYFSGGDFHLVNKLENVRDLEAAYQLTLMSVDIELKVREDFASLLAAKQLVTICRSEPKLAVRAIFNTVGNIRSRILKAVVLILILLIRESRYAK